MRQKPTGRPSSSEQIIRDIKPKINLNSVFAGQTVGIREVADQIWLVSFMHYDLGFFDKEEGRVEPGPKGIRTPVAAVKGQCPRPLDDGDAELNYGKAWWS